MKRYSIFIGFLIGLCTSCTDYLDIVPEGVPSIEHAFTNRINAEKFLTTCYSYIPNFENPEIYPGFMAGDELLMTDQIYSSLPMVKNAWWIGQGAQNSNDPYLNYWDGGQGAKNLWIGIRDCNIFLENINRPRDLDDYERDQWIAEVTFLKAFYHFYLMQLYGPIPIMDKNVSVNASIEEVRKYRDPLDDCVNFIIETIDKAIPNLPLRVNNPSLEMGRITKPIAAAVKAQVLLFAASPLMNGNPDYISVKDNRGINLFPQKLDPEKWQKAAIAAKEAIEIAHEAEHKLYVYTPQFTISTATQLLLTISEAVCDRWNPEIIWGATNPTKTLQTYSMPKLSTKTHFHAEGWISVSFPVIEGFYSNNGVPINEDNSQYWQNNYSDRDNLIKIPDEGNNKYLLEIGGITAKMHLNREMRFYGNLCFDRGTIYMSDCKSDNQTDLYIFHSLNQEFNGQGTNRSVSGYNPKKILSYKTSLTDEKFIPYRYTFPIIRLAELYLMYAEAQNEALDQPDESVYQYIDLVRARVGLKGVVESWRNYSKFPDKPLTKEGMRQIIRQERLNELACEGKRFWDMRRWKITLPSKFEGWNRNGITPEDYYRRITVLNRPEYYYRDFLWPIKLSTILKNPNLVQNPGW